LISVLYGTDWGKTRSVEELKYYFLLDDELKDILPISITYNSDWSSKDSLDFRCTQPAGQILFSIIFLWIMLYCGESSICWENGERVCADYRRSCEDRPLEMRMTLIRTGTSALVITGLTFYPFHETISEKPSNPVSIPAKIDKKEVVRHIFFDRVNKTIPFRQPNEQLTYQLELMAASVTSLSRLEEIFGEGLEVFVKDQYKRGIVDPTMVFHGS
jgi:hypothetical protein